VIGVGAGGGGGGGVVPRLPASAGRTLAMIAISVRVRMHFVDFEFMVKLVWLF
jgi:hypothetical protein